MSKHKITLVGAAILFAASLAAAGSLDFWEDARGAQDVTALFPTGPAQVAHIVFDADSAEGGGIQGGASEIEIRPTGSAVFTAFSCAFQGCSPGNDYTFVGGGAGTGLVLVTDPDFEGEKHGIHDLGTITFEAPQEPGGMPLIGCNYVDLNFVERTCTPFVLVTLPEPAGIAALLAGAALLLGPLRRWRAR